VLNTVSAWSAAKALAPDQSEYSLIIGADDTQEIALDTQLLSPTADAYMVEISDTATVCRRPQLVRDALPGRYEGVLLEYLTCEGAVPANHLAAITIRRNHYGARRKGQNVIDAYRRAADSLPARAEPLHWASRFRRYKGRHKEGYQIAKKPPQFPYRPIVCLPSIGCTERVWWMLHKAGQMPVSLVKTFLPRDLDLGPESTGPAMRLETIYSGRIRRRVWHELPRFGGAGNPPYGR
jgi:hypothetical protein